MSGMRIRSPRINKLMAIPAVLTAILFAALLSSHFMLTTLELKWLALIGTLMSFLALLAQVAQ
jgi:hypothetical protein